MAAEDYGVDCYDGDDDDDCYPIMVQSVERETPKAWLFMIDDEKYWFPKSQLDWNGKELWVGAKNVEVEIPQWLLDEKGIDYAD